MSETRKYRKRIRTCQCGFTGTRLQFKQDDCLECVEKIRIERFTVPCKGCGTRISTSLKKPFCSHECRKKHNPSKAIQIDCPCVVCGTRIVRKEYKQSGNYCCSLDCQRVWCLEINKGRTNGNGVDWKERGKKAKAEWKRKARKARDDTSVYVAWIRAIKCEMSKTRNTTVSQDPWLQAIKSRLGSHEGRDVIRKQVTIASGSIDAAMKKLDGKRKYHNLDVWSKKIGNKLSSMASRRRRKSNVKKRKGTGDTNKAEGVPIQMCFDWLDD